MRGKKFFPASFISNFIIFSCLVVIVFEFGCKEKPDQATGQETDVDVNVISDKETAGELQRQGVDDEEYSNQLVFDMQEMPVFDLSDEISREFLRGQIIFCDNQSNRVWPCKYPHFVSDKPLHGSVNFTGKFARSFPPVGMYYLVIDESAGTGTGYDRLYFDCDGDRDLTDEKPLKSLKDPPKAALRQYSSTELQVCFESFELTFDYGSAGKHAVEIMARLMARERSSRLTFFATKVRRGEIEIGDAKYDALLGHSYSIGSPFDKPETVFHLIPKSNPQHPSRWWGADQLNSTHLIAGDYYRFATTPLGDKLFVRPYDGELGTFEVSAGARNVEQVTAQGSLRCEETAVAIGAGLELGWPKPTRSCRLPEGDYMPAIMTLKLDQLSITISNNYHSDGQPRGRTSNNYIYGIKIRKDKPFVLDLTNKPEMLFASPVKGKRVKLGDQLEVKAVLIDPELDIMIRHINDTSKMEKQEYTTPDGRKNTIERPVSLDPKVIITRADGEKVAEGVMPFG